MPRYLAPLQALLLLPVAAWGQQQPQQQQPGSSLLSSRCYSTGGEPGAVLAPNTALEGLPLGELSTGSAADCAQLCRQDEECGWMNWCPSGEV